MSSPQAVILALFSTLSQEDRVETVQSLVALLAGAPSSGGAAAKKVVKASAKASAAAPKEKRAASEWTQYVMAVKAETGLPMTEAMKEASRRREAGDPSCPLPPAPPKKSVAASAAAAPSSGGAKKLTVASKKATPPPPPPPVEEVEQGVELEEAEIEGVDYVYLPACENAAWLKEADGSRGAWAGYLNTETGEFDLSRPAPELEEAE